MMKIRILRSEQIQLELQVKLRRTLNNIIGTKMLRLISDVSLIIVLLALGGNATNIVENPSPRPILVQSIEHKTDKCAPGRQSYIHDIACVLEIFNSFLYNQNQLVNCLKHNIIIILLVQESSKLSFLGSP